jgi:hypothetical protein
MTPTRTRENPYPWLRVRFFAGTGTGSAGYPCLLAGLTDTRNPTPFCYICKVFYESHIHKVKVRIDRVTEGSSDSSRVLFACVCLPLCVLEAAVVPVISPQRCFASSPCMEDEAFKRVTVDNVVLNVGLGDLALSLQRDLTLRARDLPTELKL